MTEDARIDMAGSAALSHVNAEGHANMVDVSAKADTRRTAVATGAITMSPSAFAAVRDNGIAKGDVLGVGRIAGIMAAKRTSDIIPLCHPIPVTSVEIELALEETLPGVRATSRVATNAATGVEMEAIVAVTVTLATIYDMAKSADRAMSIGGIRLLSKTGGRSGDYRAS